MEHEQLRRLEMERERLSVSLEHLERSNAELKEAIQSEGDEDGEYRHAIGENIVVIAKYRARRAQVEHEIAEFTVAVPAEIDAKAPDGDETMTDAADTSGFKRPNGASEGVYL